MSWNFATSWFKHIFPDVIFTNWDLIKTRLETIKIIKKANKSSEINYLKIRFKIESYNNNMPISKFSRLF